MSFKLEHLAAICLISFEPPTEAHDIYLPLKDRWGNSCCNDQDCRPVPYRITPAGVRSAPQIASHSINGITRNS